MSNQEVVDFVENHRHKCRQDYDNEKDVQYVSYDNATIAHLLCEEARVRWLTFIEAEDVLIDDIS